MKGIFLILFLHVFLNSICQVVELDTLNFNYVNKVDENGTKYLEINKRLPIYKIDSCAVELLKVLLDNCNSNCSLDKFPYGFLFYSKNKKDSFSIIIKPIESTWFYNANFFGVFKICNRYFYCMGDKPNSLITKTASDSIVIKNRIRDVKSKKDSIAIIFDINRFSDLNTLEIEKFIFCNHEKFIFYIQPCNNMSRNELRKINKIKSGQEVINKTQ